MRACLPALPTLPDLLACPARLPALPCRASCGCHSWITVCHSRLLLVLVRNKPISEDRRIQECNAVQSGIKYIWFGANAASNFRFLYREVEAVGQHSWTPRRTDRPTQPSVVLWLWRCLKRGTKPLVTPYIVAGTIVVIP